MSPKLQKKRTYLFHANYGVLKVVDGIKNKKYLLSLTLRQLRQEASKLSIPLYSRKTKAVLIDLVDKYQKNTTENDIKTSTKNTSPKISEFTSQSVKEEVNTKIVFLPRDPEWAYVFWQISEIDRDFNYEKLAKKYFFNSNRSKNKRELSKNSILNQWCAVEAAIKWDHGKLAKDIKEWQYSENEKTLFHKKKKLKLKFTQITFYKWTISLAYKDSSYFMPNIICSSWRV